MGVIFLDLVVEAASACDIFAAGITVSFSYEYRLALHIADCWLSPWAVASKHDEAVTNTHTLNWICVAFQYTMSAHHYGQVAVCNITYHAL